MNILSLFKKKREPKVVSTHLIDGDGFVTIGFEYPYKIMLFVYDDGSVKKGIVEKNRFAEGDKHFFDTKEVYLWDYMTVYCVLTEAIRRCDIDEYSYEYDAKVMGYAKHIVKELKAHNVRFMYCKGEESDFRHSYKMNEVQFLHYVKFLNAEM